MSRGAPSLNCWNCPRKFQMGTIEPFPAVCLVLEGREEGSVEDGQCYLQHSNQIQICVKENQTVLLARDQAGTYLPYFDELAILKFTSPSGVVRGLNVVRWEDDCSNPDYPTVNISQNVNDLVSESIDVTDLLNGECGRFTVNISIYNKYSPTAWSTAWLVTP